MRTKGRCVGYYVYVGDKVMRAEVEKRKAADPDQGYTDEILGYEVVFDNGYDLDLANTTITATPIKDAIGFRQLDRSRELGVKVSGRMDTEPQKRTDIAIQIAELMHTLSSSRETVAAV